jgi:hypothetical protein
MHARRRSVAHLRRLVLDTLKPHDPNIIVLAERLSDLDGVSAVNVAIVEMDRRVENVKLTIVGDDIRFDAVRGVIEALGGAVHSIDEVVAGATIIDATPTTQD